MYLYTKTCNACTSWEKRKNSEPELHEQFMETRNCPIIDEDSAGSMEAVGLVDCFMNSIKIESCVIHIILGMVTQKHIMRKLKMTHTQV